ncbi:hypothetical protein ACEPPN_016287 [Leptodophora sp. 'Broadleaf-Isolate-01']
MAAHRQVDTSQAALSLDPDSAESAAPDSCQSIRTSVIDLEKGKTFTKTTHGPATFSPRKAASDEPLAPHLMPVELWWMSICDAVAPWKCHPLKWYRLHKQEAEEEKQRLRNLYEDIQTERTPVENYAPGWPQYAAFLNSQDNFPMFRRFDMLHLELLVDRQAELQQLEKKLKVQNHSDAVPGSGHEWRLQMSESDFLNCSDSTRRDLLNTIEQKVLVYDQLLFNAQNLWNQETVPQQDLHSVFNWISQERPVAPGHFDWIYHATDIVPLFRIDPVEHSILTSFMKRLFRSDGKGKDSIIKQYSLSGVTIAAKLCFVLLAVSILIIPVFILMWVPETKAGISATFLVSVLLFSTIMTLFTKSTIQIVLAGTAG